jgi:glycosyltransferase involved in cell wall biosynthesis
MPIDTRQFFRRDAALMRPVGISVVIPTACRMERAASIRRAIESVLSQENVDVELIVVVNGPTHDRGLRAELEANPALRVAYLPEPNLPAAHRHGRTMVTRPFFAFLDDDDEYLPRALETRAAEMLADPRLDVVATNGIWAPDNSPYIKRTEGVEADPLMALLRGNWLGSCGALFRSATVSPDYFDGRTRHYEWTMLGFRLALAGRRIRFLDVPTYILNETPESLSRSDAYCRAEPPFLTSMLEFDLAPRYRKRIREKILESLHTLAGRALAAGRIGEAWGYHVRSLMRPQGFKYVVFTRHLVWPTMRWVAGRSGGDQSG